ncbi:hypothetical protein EX30DRAFT_289988, partial [Ascodesmis nigricans]
LTKWAIEQVTVSQVFGIVDMYQDLDRSNSDQNRIERKLSQLEARAAETLSRVKRAFYSGDAEVTITRTHLFDLRKFLFIMHYRSPLLHERLTDSPEEYSANDRDALLFYMRTNVLDVTIDYEGEWLKTILQRAYPPDARWFYMNVTAYFLAFCTPSASFEEFLLTQNAYSILERINDGPDSKWTATHLLSPLTPDLIMVCRLGFMPHNSPSGLHPFESFMWEVTKASHTYCLKETLLEALPVSNAGNSYTTIVNGVVVPLLDSSTRRPEKDQFFFPFHQLPTKYVQRINSVILEQTHSIAMVVYRSEKALQQALLAY